MAHRFTVYLELLDETPDPEPEASSSPRVIIDVTDTLPGLAGLFAPATVTTYRLTAAEAQSLLEKLQQVTHG